MDIAENNAELNIIQQSESIESVKEHAHNFFDLSEQEKAHLNRRIEECHGEIEIFVHPFFTEHGDRSGQSERFRDYEKSFPERKIGNIKAKFFELMKRDEQSTSPIFMFEEKAYMADAKQSIETEVGMDMTNHLYVVATRNESPKPDCPSGIKNEDFRANDPWNSMAKMLAALGVKRIKASGAYLDMRYANNPMDGCLGETVNNLSRHFDVEITEFAYPQRGSDRKDGAVILKSNN